MKTAIECKTKEEYDKLMRILEAEEIMCSDEKPTETNHWNEYKEETCVDLETNEMGGYCNKKWYQRHGYKVISLQEYLSEFKVGDKVRAISKTVLGYENWKAIKQNQIGYISKIYGDGSGRNDENCLVVSKIFDNNGGDYFASKDLKLIKEEERKFKVGDRVKTPKGIGIIVDVKNPKYRYPYAVNLEEDILEHCRTREPYHIKNRTDVFDKKDLELTKEGITIGNKQMLGVIELMEKACEYKVGDLKYIADKVNKITSPCETISKVGKTMNKITSAIKRIFNEDLQKQYKAGLIDECGDLTELGREELQGIQRDKYVAEMTKVAEGIIKEAKEDK